MNNIITRARRDICGVREINDRGPTKEDCRIFNLHFEKYFAAKRPQFRRGFHFVKPIQAGKNKGRPRCTPLLELAEAYLALEKPRSGCIARMAAANGVKYKSLCSSIWKIRHKRKLNSLAA